MDIATIVFIIVATALALGAIVWLEIYSRKNNGKLPADSNSETRRLGERAVRKEA